MTKLQKLERAFNEADMALSDGNTWAENLAAAKVFDKARQAFFAEMNKG